MHFFDGVIAVDGLDFDVGERIFSRQRKVVGVVCGWGQGSELGGGGSGEVIVWGLRGECNGGSHGGRGADDMLAHGAAAAAGGGWGGERGEWGEGGACVVEAGRRSAAGGARGAGGGGGAVAISGEARQRDAGESGAVPREV